MKNKSLSLIVLPSIALFLSACGGGGSTNTQQPSVVVPTPVVIAQPRILDSENWQSARLIQAANPMQSTVEIVGSELSLNIVSNDIAQGAHLQIYINSDNKPETGFQFENQAWEESGVDFLIEDGDLFESTQNNTGWNWNVNVGAIDYTINSDSASAKIDLSLLGDICNNLKVGVMTRDEFWDISTFSPASSQMQTYTVSYCNTEVADTINPEISLLGANPINLNINDVFTDPGATASDNIDGDITSRIHPKSTVNTAIAGTYEVSYLVTDIAGNSTTITRIVIVNEIAPPESIVIDGNSNDWNDIPTFSSSADAIMKVSDDTEKLYILITSSNLGANTQILMDTDNNASTGLELSAQVNAWAGGADYMLENNSLDKSKSNTGWSWDYGIAPIEYIKTADTLEIAIKKSDFNQLANIIPMGYVSRTAEWNANYVLPAQALPSYTLQFPTVINPVTANNDSVTTTNDLSVQIDVLANDSSGTNSALTVQLTSQPNSGSASIVQNKVVYTPDPLFTGTVNFAYEISDSNGNKDSANIKVIVTEPIDLNTAPVARNDSAATLLNTAVIIAALSNDSDIDGDVLSIASVTNPSNGTAEIVEGSVVYSPANQFIGTNTFSYTINDGEGGTATATITVSVNALPNVAPIAVNDLATTIGINTLQIAVLANDSDTDGDTLQITDFTQPANGSLTLTTATGTFNYTPNATFSGTDNFTYTISDGNDGSDTATVSVNVPTNNAPDAVEDIASVFFNETVTVDVLANDTDPDGDTLSIVPSSVAAITAGITATLNPDGTILVDPQGTIASLSVFYTVTDGRGGTDSAVLTIASTDPNDDNISFPTVNNEFVTTPVNTPIFIDVLANDFDSDGDTLSIDMVDDPDNGTTEKVTQNGVAGILYTPDPGFTGVDIFFYGVPDGRGNNGSGFVEVTVQ